MTDTQEKRPGPKHRAKMRHKPPTAVETVPVWFAHPNGVLDPRDPSARVVVGPTHSRIGAQVILTADMPIAAIRALRAYRYQQKQIAP